MPALSKRTAIILFAVESFLIILLLIFNFLLGKYGAFWRKTTTPAYLPVSLTTKSKRIVFKGNDLGEGYYLPSGTPVLAVLDGWFKPASSLFTKEDGTKIWSQEIILKSKDGSQEAHYSFQGKFVDTKERWVRQGEEIATLGSASLPWSDVNLLLIVEEKGEVIP